MPDKVIVTETEHARHDDGGADRRAGDTGKVIGRQGRIAEALRTLVAATAHHHGIRATLEIRDPE